MGAKWKLGWRPQTAGTLIAGPSKDDLSFKPPSRNAAALARSTTGKIAKEEYLFN
jgi:hypothetical protein